MSTRSGKRIHISPVTAKPEKTERRTRSQKNKENCSDDSVPKKKKHYVLRHPSEDEIGSDATSYIALRTRKSRRTTLAEVSNNDVDVTKPLKTARRKKTGKNASNVTQKTSKKSKKKNIGANNDTYIAIKDGINVVKKKISSGSVVIEDLNEQNFSKKSINDSHVSDDSFHSAGSDVGSPIDKCNLKKSINVKTLTETKQLDSACKQKTFFSDVENPSKSNGINADIDYLQKNSKCIDKEYSSYIEDNNYNDSGFNLLFNNKRKSRSSYQNSTLTEISADDNQNMLLNKESEKKKLSLIDCDDSSPANENNISEFSYKEDQKVNKLKKSKSEPWPIKSPTVKTNRPSVANEQSKCNATPIMKLTSMGTKNTPSCELSTLVRNSLNSSEKCKDKNYSTIEVDAKDGTFDINNSHESNTNSPPTDTQDKLNLTFEKESTNLNSTYDKPDDVSKSSLISSDTSMTVEKSISCISITSDESKTDSLINTTPVILDNDELQMTSMSTNTSKEHQKSPPDNVVVSITPSTPLHREGTFTKESPKNTTPPKTLNDSPGRTPFPSSKRSSSKKALNVTRSIEKKRNPSIAALPHTTRVMFCSPVNTPMINNQIKGKVIKSSMKGSNKSFVFNDEEPSRASAGRKRSFTHGDLEVGNIKRQRFTEGTSDRMSRSRTLSASDKSQKTPTKVTPSKVTPSKGKGEVGRVGRRKLPDFAALHQKHFDQMESLDECQRRKARRAQLLAASVVPRGRDSKADSKQSQANDTILSLKPGYSRFGFRMKSDVNPFTSDALAEPRDSKVSLQPPTARVTPAPPKACKSELPNGLKRQATLPSIKGSTARREIAKQTVMRQKSFGGKRDDSRNQNRTIIKGVRTNRRFELQMQMRNIN